MSYLLGGSNGEANTFDVTIANSAIEVLHETQSLIGYTEVVAPNQGNTYKVPAMGPISFEDYDESSDDPDFQSPAIGAKSISASPAVATTEFGIFEGWTASFPLASQLGSEIGQSFGEKVDQRVTAAFAGFKATPGNTIYTVTGGDGFDRVSALGTLTLAVEGETAATADVAVTLQGLILKVKAAWRKARNPGRPVVILSEVEENRFLGEIAVAGNASALVDEVQSTGMIQNYMGVSLVFNTFLLGATRDANGDVGVGVILGAAIGQGSLITVLKQGLNIDMGVQPKGLKMWLTGTGYFGSGVVNQAKGLSINIIQ